MNSSSNPSDYEFLLRTLSEGTHLAKAESLKRLNSLILSDKKQFSSYAKRIVPILQQLLLQPKEEINLLSCTLALEIINLNPRDIEFYIKTKLLKGMVINLGDVKAQIRKTSHYCLLAFIRTFRNFDDLIEIYLSNGISSNQWQLRQKAINSFQSILVMEMRHVNWASTEFKRIFEVLLVKLKDQNGFVQKAAEQCLLSLAKVQDLRAFSKKLPPTSFTILKGFCEQQYQIGNLHEIKLDLVDKKVQNQMQNISITAIRNLQNSISTLNIEQMKQKPEAIKQQKTLTARQSQPNDSPTYRRKPIEQKPSDRRSLRKVQSMNTTSHLKQLQYSQAIKIKDIKNPQSIIITKRQNNNVYLPPIASNVPITRQEKMEQMLGKKVLEDLKNDKDWKIRLEAVQELQSKFQIYRQEFDIEIIMKSLLPILIKLLADANFKVALIGLRVIQQILRLPQLNLQQIVPQIVQKLSDNKVALRQNVSKLIKNEYLSSKQPIWIDNLLNHLKKSNNANIRQQILNIFYKIYEDANIPYSFQKILELVCPLMDDLKTKIKIKTLDLLALITIKSQKIDRAKNLLATKMNQVYYQMYLEKINKELKIFRQQNPQETNQEKQKITQINTTQNLRKITKLGTTTSTSLPKYQKQANSTVKTAFYQPKGDQTDVLSQRSDIQNQQPKIHDITHIDSIEMSPAEGSNKKRVEVKYIRKRISKNVQSRLSSTNYSSQDSFPPFQEPQKELKNIITQIKSDDWQISNQALNKLRRIVINHDDLLVSGVVKSLVPDLMKLSESLRSTLSKNAVLVVNQLSNKVRRMLDSQFDMIFSKLIKKTLDTNSFISQQVKRALINVCSNCNETKVVNLLNSTHVSRAIPIKTALVNILEAITFLPKFYDKELEKIVTILVDFMSQGSLEIRQKTKQLLNNIILSQRGDSIMRLIPAQHKNKLKKREEVSIMKIIQPQIIVQKKDTMVQPQSKDSEELYQRKKKKNKIINFPAQFQLIQSYLQQCQSSQWKVRLQNMCLISELCKKYPEELVQHRSSGKVIDVLSKQINDPNNKVAINALRIFEQIVAKLPNLVQASLSVVLNQIFICFSSGKAEIKSLSEQLFDIICNVVQKWMLTQHLCNGILYSVQKSKPIIIAKLTNLVPSIYKVKPSIFQKNVYQMINKSADENKPQITNSLRELIKVIYTEVGEDCMSFLKQKAKQLIFE